MQSDDGQVADPKALERLTVGSEAGEHGPGDRTVERLTVGFEAGEHRPGDRTVERLTVEQAGGRRKAYRPLPPDEREAAFELGLAAYARGDYFEAHELLEPAWMGTNDLTERALYQGLIKLAAAYVHAVRGNPSGVAKNLDGAASHLRVARSGVVDVAALVAAIEERLAALPVVVPAPKIPTRPGR